MPIPASENERFRLERYQSRSFWKKQSTNGLLSILLLRQSPKTKISPQKASWWATRQLLGVKVISLWDVDIGRESYEGLWRAEGRQ